jgi:Sulfotransferase family
VRPPTPQPVFVFLIGNGRSGSTLVHELLTRHPATGFVSNLEDRLPLGPAAGRFNSAVYRRLPAAFTRKGRLRYAPSEAYRALTREVSVMVAQPYRDLLAGDAMPWAVERFRAFFARRAHVQRKPVFVHKFTGWPRTGFIRVAFPEARFIHVVRDGRAVVASDLQAAWWRGYLGPDFLHRPLAPEYRAEWEASGRSFAILAAAGWKSTMDAMAAARALTPAAQWLDVRFEDVLADPRARFREMLEFAGLPAAPAFERALERTRFRRDREQAFRRSLDPATIAMIDASLAEHLRAWGYQP